MTNVNPSCFSITEMQRFFKSISSVRIFNISINKYDYDMKLTLTNISKINKPNNSDRINNI